MSTKHTSGPWLPVRLDIGSRSFWIAISSEGNLPEIEANARLIAAAPDMLAVLLDSIEILDVAIESREELIGEEDEVMRDLRTQVRAALAKAGAA